MDFSKLIASSKLRQFVINVDGFEEPLVIHELSGKELIKRREEEAEFDLVNQAQESFEVRARWVARMLKGSMPKKSEVKALIDNYSPAFITEIYVKGANYIAPGGESDIEAAQKNS